MSANKNLGGTVRVFATRASRLCGPAILVASLAILAITPLSAHHARPEYDRYVQTTITGTVKEFRLVNPHAWIHISVTQKDGTVEDWSFEGGSVGRLNRVGWSGDMLMPGDNISVTFNPRRDGAPGGLFRAVTTADGIHRSTTRGRRNGRL
jgi:hypothetical protein